MERHGLSSFLKEELEPYPGRLSGALRDTLSLTLAILLVMTLRIHGAALGVYFILLLQRQHPSLSFRSAVTNLLAIAAGMASCLVLIQVTDNDPMARILGLIVVMGASGFLLAASNQAAMTIAFSLFFFLTLTGFETHQPARKVVENTLWLLASTGISVACAVAVEYLFGSKSPAQELIQEMNTRLEAIEALFTLCAESAGARQLENARHRVVQLSHAGQSRMQRLYARAVEGKGLSSQLPTGTRVRIPILADLTDLALATSVDPARSARIAHLCRLVRTEQPIREIEPNPALATPMEELLHELATLPLTHETPEDDDLLAPLPANHVPLFAADAFTNPEYAFFALKTALAATACYLFYNAIGWPGLATSVVTVLITALGTTAAMKQKQIFRLAGAAIGGVLAIIVVAFVFPAIDSITVFLLVNAGVTFLAVWWSRSPHSGYVGYQIVLAFYLVALQSFDAPVHLDPARDRVVGIALGLIVMWFVFDQMWPVRTIAAMAADLAAIRRETAQLLRLPLTGRSHAQSDAARQLRHSVGQLLMRMREMRETVDYEIGTTDRAAHVEQSEALFRAASATATLFWTHAMVLQRPGLATKSAAEYAQLADKLEQLAASGSYDLSFHNPTTLPSGS
jgi:multidrug resistance protein MdtO